MERILVVAMISAACVAASLLNGCRDSGKSRGSMMAAPVVEDADWFWARIQAANYRGWDPAPGFERRQPGTGPHGDTIQVFVNPVVSGSLGGGSQLSEWPIGSFLIKDGYLGGVQVYVAAMEKRSDGWLWGEYDASGTPLLFGRPEGCISCHSAGEDQVRSVALP